MRKITIEMEADKVAHLFAFLTNFGIPAMKMHSHTPNHMIAYIELMAINEDLKHQYSEKVTGVENEIVKRIIDERYGS